MARANTIRNIYLSASIYGHGINRHHKAHDLWDITNMFLTSSCIKPMARIITCKSYRKSIGNIHEALNFLPSLYGSIAGSSMPRSPPTGWLGRHGLGRRAAAAAGGVQVAAASLKKCHNPLALGPDEPVAVHGLAWFHTLLETTKYSRTDAYRRFFTYTCKSADELLLVINLGNRKKIQSSKIK